MLKHIILFSALILWMASVLDSSLIGVKLYLVWFLAFSFSLYGYSLIFAIEGLLTSGSFYVMDTTSQSLFLASVLPWIFGILLLLFVVMIGIFYLSYNTKEISDFSLDDKHDHYEKLHWFFWSI